MSVKNDTQVKHTGRIAQTNSTRTAAITSPGWMGGYHKYNAVEL